MIRTSSERRLLAALSIALWCLPPLAARADDTRAFLADARRFGSMASFRMRLNSSLAGSPNATETLTYVAPDSLRVEIPAKKFTAVIIGSYIYLRKGHGRWKRVAVADDASPLAAVHATSNIAQRLAGSDVRFAGTKMLGGKPMHVYDIQAPERAGYPDRSERIWIGAEDGYPHLIEQRNGAYASTAAYSAFNRLFSVSQ